MPRKLALSLLLLLPASYSSASLTLSQLIANSRLLVLDSTSTTRQRFTDSQVTEFINQGQRHSSEDSSCFQSATTFQLTPGTTYYALPTNFSTVLRITVGQKYIPQQSVAALDGKSRGWEAASGYPTYYFINFSTRGAVGFAPWPQQSTDTDTVKVEYQVQVNDLANSGDLPFSGINEMQEYNYMLTYYAASMMESVNGDPDMAKYYMGLYMDAESKFKHDCTTTPAYLPSAAGSL